MPRHFVEIAPYVPISTKWGLLAEGPPLFSDKWERLRAAGRSQKLSRAALNRLEWMLWYETVGCRNARATCRHFGIAPKVFYFWRKRFSETQLSLLEERSRRPHRTRATALTSAEELRVCQLRREYLQYSKLKLTYLYKERYGTAISSWKIQKVIQKNRLYRNPKRAENMAKKRKRAFAKRRITELVTKPHTGFLFSIDTIVLHWGPKRYLLTAIDKFSRLAYARMYATHSSLAAADFLRRLHLLVDGQLTHIQTDNGSEFHKHFEVAIRDLKLTHWWSRTHTPKDNAMCERFNRTVKEEFITMGNAVVEVDVFNKTLTDWLVEYDFHRPHAALGYRTPIEVAGAGKALPMYSSRTRRCALD
jgi:transposase InsO family protein